jgi:hypothetical protein
VRADNLKHLTNDAEKPRAANGSDDAFSFIPVGWRRRRQTKRRGVRSIQRVDERRPKPRVSCNRRAGPADRYLLRWAKSAGHASRAEGSIKTVVRPQE